MNSSNAVGSAAVYELLISNIVDTNLNIGAQGPYWAVVRPPRSYLTVVRQRGKRVNNEKWQMHKTLGVGTGVPR